MTDKLDQILDELNIPNVTEHNKYCKYKNGQHSGCRLHTIGCVQPQFNHEVCPMFFQAEFFQAENNELEVINILKQCIELYKKKASDYNDPTRGGVDALANFRVTNDIGIEPYIGALVRLSDKWERIKSLVYKMNVKNEGPAVKDESIEDTLLDIINYGAIVLALYREYKIGSKTS